ncbi:MAG: bifunctional DNA primase/polymerase [Candidatus Hodarchaeales archaeon]
MPEKNNQTLKNALYYLNLGWSIIPVKNKKPLLSSWKEYQKRRATESEIRKWWRKWPNADIAVVTGTVSGIIVVDVDNAAGEHAIKPYVGKSVLTATTPRGGKHYYFKHPGTIVPNAVRFLPGVDARGDGGYVVIYNWDNDRSAEIAAPPPALLELITKRTTTPVKWNTNIPEGERDISLTKLVGRLFHTGMSINEVIVLANAINTAYCKPPLETKQVRKIVYSIAKREIRKSTDEQKKEFKTLTTTEMLRRYGEDETQWIIDGWLPEASCGLIVAPPGSYKTWVLEALAFAIATGYPFLGQYPIMKHGPILFIQQEDPFSMIMKRIACMFKQQMPTEKEINGDMEYVLDCSFIHELDTMPIHWHVDRELNLEDKNCMTRFETKIAELKPILTIIDPLYSGVSAKDYMALGAQAMLFLKKLRDKYNTGFAIAHHTTVAGSRTEDRASIWGSQFLNAWTEWGWQIRETDDKNTVRVMRHFKSSENPKRLHVKFTITNFSFNVEINDVLVSVPERIKEIMLNGERFRSVREIAEVIGCSKSMAAKTITKMGIEKDQEGYYKLLDREQ